MLTTVKTLADVRQVLRGYASPHPPEAEDYYDRRLAERAAAKAREEKEPIAQEAREAERATARHAVAGPEQAARDQKFERYVRAQREARRCAAGFFAREQIRTDDRRGGP